MELTREIVLAEPPGKRLDSWIAEKVMGWRKKTFPGGGGGFTAWVDENEKVMKLISNSTMSETCYRCDYFRPSTDISAAWEVVEMFSYIDIHRYDDFFACAIYPIGNSAVIRARGKTMPEAICKAALLAVMGE